MREDLDKRGREQMVPSNVRPQDDVEMLSLWSDGLHFKRTHALRIKCPLNVLLILNDFSRK